MVFECAEEIQSTSEEGMYSQVREVPSTEILLI
jgi:hypothetical protein